jgi:hypothetical protein
MRCIEQIANKMETAIRAQFGERPGGVCISFDTRKQADKSQVAKRQAKG